MLVNKITGKMLMFGSRSTNLLHAGLYSASVAALIGFCEHLVTRNPR